MKAAVESVQEAVQGAWFRRGLIQGNAVVFRGHLGLQMLGLVQLLGCGQDGLGEHAKHRQTQEQGLEPRHEAARPGFHQT